MKLKVLVTGINGFTGQYVRQLLVSRGYDVMGLVKEKSNSSNNFSADITNKNELIEGIGLLKPDYIIHLAALAFVGHSDQKSFYDVNLFGSLNLLEAVLAANYPVKKIIIASSANIYGAPNVETIDETITPAPISHYAVSKMAMEYMVRTWFDKLPIIITRPFNYTGPGQDERFLIPKIVNHFRRKEKVIELGNLNVARDFSDVRDVASAYVDLMESSIVSEVFNVCSGKAFALTDILHWMHEISRHEIEIKVNPAFVRSNEIPILVGSCEKLRKSINYQPHYSFHETLQAMFACNGE